MSLVVVCISPVVRVPPHISTKKHFPYGFDWEDWGRLDALEVLNGYQDPVRRSVDRTIDDWMGLLNHGQHCLTDARHARRAV